MKESAIDYNIQFNGIECPDKLTTVGTSRYNLFDAHNIDWDNSRLKYLKSIPTQLFALFASEEEISDIVSVVKKGEIPPDTRKRYKDSDDCKKDYENVPTSGINSESTGPFPPMWYKGGRASSFISTSGQLLDVIDYLTFATSYTFLFVEEMNNRSGGTTPLLRFMASDMVNIGAKVLSNEKLYEITREQRPIITIYPNQTNSNYADFEFFKEKNLLFVDINKDKNNRAYEFRVIPEDDYGNGIPDAMYFYVKGDHTKGASLQNFWASDIVTTTGNPFSPEDLSISTNFNANAISDVNKGMFNVLMTIKGWAPLESSFWTGYDDERTVKYTFYTPTLDTKDKFYAKSNDISMFVTVKKDLNIFDYVFINGKQYYYFPVNSFPNFGDEYNNAAFLVDVSNIPHFTNSLNRESVINLITDVSILNGGLCVYNGNNSNNVRINIINGKKLKFEVYPKYYGNDNYDGNKPTYFNISDIDYGDVDPNNNINPIVNHVQSSNNDTKVYISSITDVNKVLGGINRKGFSFELVINQNITTNENNNNFTEISLKLNSTYFVSGMKMTFRFFCVKPQYVLFIDTRRSFSYRSYKYDNETLKYNDPVIEHKYNLQSNIGLLDSYCTFNEGGSDSLPSDFTWYLRLPIFTERSWIGETGTIADKSSKILPSVLSGDEKSKSNALEKPLQEEKIPSKNFIGINIANDGKFMPRELNPENASDYTSGYPSLLIGSQSSSDPYLSTGGATKKSPEKLIYAIVQGQNTDISSKFEIDFEKTYLANCMNNGTNVPGTGFLELCDDNFVSYIKTTLTTNEDRGKAFCARYCGIYQNNDDSKSTYLVCYRPTIPDKLMDKDIESLYRDPHTGDVTNAQNIGLDSVPNFILYLTIKSNDTQPANGGLPNFAGNDLKVNLVVERANRELAGWAYKSSSIQNTSGINIKTLTYKSNTKIRDIIDCKPFGKNQHNIQTRLTTLFIPVKNVESNDHYSYVEALINNISTKFYYVFNKDTQEITFYSSDKNENTNKFLYKIDNVAGISLYGNMDSDNLFRGFYGDAKREFILRVYRNDNPLIGSKTSDMSKWHIYIPYERVTIDGRLCGLRATLTTLLSSQNIPKRVTLAELNDYSSINLFNDFSTIQGNIDTVYGNSINFKDIQLLSVTGIISSKDTFEELELGNSKKMWESSNISESFEEYIDITNGIPSYGATEIRLNTSGFFNKLYDNIKDEVNFISYYYTIEDNGVLKINFDSLCENYLSNTIYSSVKTLRFRIIGMLPMTDTYRGAFLDIKFIIPIQM